MVETAGDGLPAKVLKANVKSAELMRPGARLKVANSCFYGRFIYFNSRNVTLALLGSH